MSFRERLDTLSRGEIAGLIVVLVAVLGGAGLWYARSLPKPVHDRRVGTRRRPNRRRSSPSPSVTLIVDVAGEVREPGVYEFVEGDRVIDAIERAGGSMPKADLSLLNLAAPLADGTQILVPQDRRRQRPACRAGRRRARRAVSSTSIRQRRPSSSRCPGIGEVLAATIVEYRDTNGPFASVEDLMDVSGIGPATLDEIRDQVTV